MILVKFDFSYFHQLESFKSSFGPKIFGIDEIVFPQVNSNFINFSEPKTDFEVVNNLKQEWESIGLRGLMCRCIDV